MDVDHETITPAMDGLRAAAHQPPGRPGQPGLRPAGGARRPRGAAGAAPGPRGTGDDAGGLGEHQPRRVGRVARVDGAREHAALAFEGHWLLDGLDEEQTQIVVGPVPAVPRFILVKLLGGAYRRRRALLWGGTPAVAVPPLSVDDTRVWSS